MHPRTVLLAALAVAGCASRPGPAAQAAREPSVGTTPVRWSGNFQPQQQRVAGLGPTQKNRAYGTISLSPTASDSDRTQVQLTLNAAVSAGQTLTWGIYPGRCGSGSNLAMPLVPTSNLPQIEVVRSGGAQMNSEFKLRLPGSGGYQVNIFWGQHTTDLADVMTCANLSPQSK